MRRFWTALALAWVGLLCFDAAVYAGKAGRSDVVLRVAGGAQPKVNVGDEITVEVFIFGNGEAMTGVVTFIDFDDETFELIPAQVAGDGVVRPFTQGNWMRGSVFQNGTLGEGSTTSNNIPQFNMVYHEDIPVSGFGGSQRSAFGDGTVATFRLRTISKPVTGTSGVNLVRTSPTGSESGYFKQGDPGNVYSFRNVNNLTVSVRGLELDIELDDLYLLPGQVDSTIDLDDSVDDVSNPDPTLTWTNSVVDSMTVAINPISHRVLVDTRFIQVTDTTNFIGIRPVQFTATTRFDDQAVDNIRIIVDTPVELVDDINPDTLRYFEDRDTTFVLTAVDPDPGAVVTFAPLDTLSNIFAFIDTQFVQGDTIRQTIRMSSTEHFHGTREMQFSAIDQFGRGDTTSVRFEIAQVNDPPEFILPFPDIEVDAVGQSMIDLESHVRDIDDDHHTLQFAFTGVDSIAFVFTTLNRHLIITPVPPFQGVRTATVVVTDTSNAAAVQRLTVRVLPPKDPQPPQVLIPDVKVGVRVGAEASTMALDPLVTDIDTPDENLVWTGRASFPMVLDGAALANRQLRISAQADLTGYVPFTLRVTDPTQLSDSLLVRIYASSVVTGVPVTGGIPDRTIVVGTSDTLSLNDYYFDSNHSDDQVTWTAEGNRDVSVAIDPATNQVILTPSLTSTNIFEDIAFRVLDPQNNTATDTMRVTILDPGSVVLDLSVLGSKLDLGLGQPDTLNLNSLVLIGNPDNLVWQAESRNTSHLFTQVIGKDLLLIGLRIGSNHVVLTATDTSSAKSATDSVLVNVGVVATADTLIVQDVGNLILTSNRDTTIDLAALVVAGNLANVVWTSPGNDNVNVNVEIDTLNQVAIVRPADGFVGNAGTVTFLATDVVSGSLALSTASPIQVLRGVPLGVDLLKISVVINPVLKNFLDVFVRSRRDLLSEPFLEFQSGTDITTTRTSIPVNVVEQVQSMWVGDLRLSDSVTGVVELSATGIVSGSRVALTDTLRLQIEQATVRSTFSLVHSDATVTLPAGGVDAQSMVALIPERQDDNRAKSAQGELVQVSNTYTIYAPDAQVQKAGFIAIETPETNQAGIYRWDIHASRWVWVGDKIESNQVGGAFYAFGRYGVFVDRVVPSFGDYEINSGNLMLYADDLGSGVGQVNASIDGQTVEATATDGQVVIGLTGVDLGRRNVRVELIDLAGNQAIWERAVDFERSHLAPQISMLHQNFPNPFNPQTTIRFDLSKETDVRLVVYNALGQTVRTLMAGNLPAGQHVVMWDARDDFGRDVGVGMYVYRIESKGFLQARKMLLLK